MTRVLKPLDRQVSRVLQKCSNIVVGGTILAVAGLLLIVYGSRSKPE